MTNDLRAYKASVLAAMKRAKESGEPEVFSNSGPEHARIVLEVMLDAATSSVDVLSGKMDSVAWSSSTISNYLRRHPTARVRVILDETQVGEIPECSVLNDLPDEDRIELRWLSAPLGRHLCVIDQAHVRLEYDKQTAEASITFGDPEGAGNQAAQIFEQLWDYAERREHIAA